MEKREKLANRLMRSIINFRHLLLQRDDIREPEVDYDAYWKVKTARNELGKPNPFQRERAQFVAERIDENDTLLDVGCGDGAVILAVNQQKPVRLIAADVSSYVLDFLRDQQIETTRFDFTTDRVGDLPNADHVLLLEVLEHMQNPEAFLEEVCQVCRKSIFFSVPNTGFIAWRLRLLFGSFPVQWKVHPGEHLRYWTLRDMRWWLDQLGYGGRYELYGYEGFPFLNRLWPALFAQGLIVQIKVMTD